MKVAIVGAGYAGLALAYHFKERQVDVTVFAEGEGASHASTGLLHPSPGKKGISWRGEEGMQASLELLQAVGGHVYENKGIWREGKIVEGAVVFSRLYLQELKKGCKVIGQRITSLKELDGFDAVVLATGAETLQFEECKHLPLKFALGQSLVCRWPQRLPRPLLDNGHITPTEDPDFCQVGSTYEHTSTPDPTKALGLLDQVAQFYPPAKDFKIVEVRSGVRIAPKVGYRPLIEKIAPRAWVFTGLGSRGLLYHALLSKSLVMTVINNI